MAAGHSENGHLALWQAGLAELLGRIAGRFVRVEPRRRARAFVLGLLADLSRKNCWTIAEHAGNLSPDGMLHLLARAAWDHDGVRDDSAPTWSSTWTTRRRCWWTRPAI